MSYTNNRDDRELNKFSNINDKPAVDVNVIGDFLNGVKYDYIGATYPTTSSELYTYNFGGSGGTTVAAILVTYSDSTKEVLTSVERTI